MKRFNGIKPTPFIRKNIELIRSVAGECGMGIADLGCGNGRNSEYFKQIGYTNVSSFDLEGGYGKRCNLEEDRIPLSSNSQMVILLNYVTMFISGDGMIHLMSEINRISMPQCLLVVELFPAVSGNMQVHEILIHGMTMAQMLSQWKNITGNGSRFIKQKGK